MSLPMKLVDFQMLSQEYQYESSKNYILDIFEKVSVSVEYIPFDILHSLIVFVQQNPNIEEKQFMHKFMTYPIHPYNYKHMHGFYKDIYASTRVWNVISNLYIKSTDIDNDLFHNMILFIQNVPDATNEIILQKLNELQNQI
jgi:hypothetical protein